MNQIQENLSMPIRRKSKTAGNFIKNMQHPFRGGKVNYLGEPSFRAWIMASLPFYALAGKKRLPMWRWLLILVPHLFLLDAEANNTAHEESIRSHRKETWHFRNAMDSASFSVMLRFAAALICAIYALYGPDPWSNSTQSLEERLIAVRTQRHLVTGRLASCPMGVKKMVLIRQGKYLAQLEQELQAAIRAADAEDLNG